MEDNLILLACADDSCPLVVDTDKGSLHKLAGLNQLLLLISKACQPGVPSGATSITTGSFFCDRDH